MDSQNGINSQKWKNVNPKDASEIEDSFSTENTVQ